MNGILNITARSVRLAALTGLRSVNGFRGVSASEWRRRQLPILCYHGVSLRDEHEWHRELFVTPAFLRRRFEILRERGYTVLALEEGVRRLRTNTLPHRSVVLTFDDGFYNFLAAAVPVLEEFGYAATNYVSTYYCVRQRPLLNLTIRYVVWRARTRIVDAGSFPELSSQIDLRIPSQRTKLSEHLIYLSEKLANDREKQDEWVGETAERLGVDWGDLMKSRMFHLMSPAEIAEVARRGFDIQLHTHRHRTPRSKESFCGEIMENRQILEQFTGHSANHFCYPSGDVDAMFLPWLRELGVETATTGVARLAKADNDVLLLPRYVDTMTQPEVIFESWLAGVGEILRRRKFI